MNAAETIVLTRGGVAELEAAVPANEVSGERRAGGNMNAIDR